MTSLKNMAAVEAEVKEGRLFRAPMLGTII